MYKFKESEKQKKIIKNTELPLTIKTDESGASSSRHLQTNDAKFTIYAKSTYSKDFHTPEMQSTLKISKGIEEIIKPITISLSDVNTDKLCGEEKVDCIIFSYI